MKKTLLILFLALSTISSFANAKGDNDVVYVWGASVSFKDSVVYFTEIQPVEGVSLIKGSGFLPHRQYYAYELKDYMSFKEGKPGRTSVIYFSKKRSKLEKKEKQIKFKLVEREGKTVRYLGDKFKFTKP